MKGGPLDNGAARDRPTAAARETPRGVREFNRRKKEEERKKQLEQQQQAGGIPSASNDQPGSIR